MFYVRVQFFDPYKRNETRGKEYTYKAYEPVEAGDMLVVDTRNGFALALCTGPAVDIPDWPETTWRTVVTRINTEKWQEEENYRLRAE